MNNIDVVGYQIFNASAAVVSAGTPVIIYGVYVDDAAASTEIHNNSEAGIGGTGLIQLVSNSAGEVVKYPYGITFSDGAYVDTGATTTVVLYKQL